MYVQDDFPLFEFSSFAPAVHTFITYLCILTVFLVNFALQFIRITSEN